MMHEIKNKMMNAVAVIIQFKQGFMVPAVVCPSPGDTQFPVDIALVKLSGSQGKTKSHEPRSASRGEKRHGGELIGLGH